jgi:hypothetical protein
MLHRNTQRKDKTTPGKRYATTFVDINYYLVEICEKLLHGDE